MTMGIHVWGICNWDFRGRRHFPGEAGFKRVIAGGFDRGLTVTLTPDV